MFRFRWADPAFVRAAMGLAVAAAVTGLGTLSAAAKPGDKIWTITLGPADRDCMDGNSPSVEVFDAVNCTSIGTRVPGERSVFGQIARKPAFS